MPRCGGCGAGWRSFGERVGKLCEYDGEEPGHAKLHRMIEEREREQAAARALAKQMAIEEERKAREWQQELQVLVQQREGMADQDLEQDCLSYFASAEVLLHSRADAAGETETSVASIAFSEAVESPSAPEGGSGANVAEDRDAELEGLPPPEGPLERWLEELFGGLGPGCSSASSSPGAPRPSAASFGELPAACCARLGEDLAEALARATKEAEEAAREAEGRPVAEASGLSEALDQLLQKYADEEAMIKAAGDAKILDVPSTVTEVESSVLNLQARAAHHRTVGGRLNALLPCLTEDMATARLVAALAMLDIGSAGAPYTAAECSASDFRSPLRALSTADVCWALCSEKRRLVVDGMLPAALGKGRWSWPELRRTGLGWWLYGTGTEVLDVVVTKLAQSAVAQLKAASSQGMQVCRQESGAGSIKRLADEALFWYVLSGTKLARLRALLKTGLLSGDAALTKLLEHPRSGDAQFVRKNAFRLLQLHRFHLAAALFVLTESYEEAAIVVAGHLRDLQLVLVLARRLPAVAQKLLRERLSESPLADRDPWLWLLLTWHTGDREAALRRARERSVQASSLEVDGGVPLFDGALRRSSSQEGLQEVTRLLSESGYGG